MVFVWLGPMLGTLFHSFNSHQFSKEGITVNPIL